MANRKCLSRSKQWLERNLKDHYSKEAYRQRLRSRSWFKLNAIDRIDALFSTGMRVIDLGSAPGGWTLYAKSKIGGTGYIVSCDILPMRRIDGVYFLKGDCSNPNILQTLCTCIGHRKVHIVLSDMSPNMTGISIIDVSKSIHLGKIALDICRNFLMCGGSFLVKVFQGEDLDEYLHDIHSLFNIVKIRKPGSSRACSREIYIVAKECKCN